MDNLKLDNRKGCLTNEIIAYRPMPGDLSCLPVLKVRMRNVLTDQMTRRQFHTTSHFVARLMLNLGHWVD